MDGKQVQHRKDRIAYWEGIINTWKQSNLSRAKFCRNSKVSQSAFGKWYKILNSDTSAHPATSTSVVNRAFSTFVPVKIEKIALTERIVLKMSLTSKVQVVLEFDLANLLQTLKLLEKL